MKEIARHDVVRMSREGAQIVEVLPFEEWREEHIPGAISLPLRRLDAEARGALDPSRPVIVYCWDSA